MPEFTYTGEEGQFFPTLPPQAAQPEPGQVYVLAANPNDGRWLPKTVTVTELREQAEALGIDTKGLKKQELLDAIEAHPLPVPTDSGDAAGITADPANIEES